MALPSTWPTWDVDANAHDGMRRHFPAALYGGIPQRFDTGRDVVRMEGMIGKAEVTKILAGTDDRKSKAWKSAQRTQQRYRTGQRGTTGIAADKAAKLATAARGWARSTFVGKKTLTVSVAVKWIISRDSKKSVPTAVLTGEALAAFKAATLVGRYVRAIQIVTYAWGLDPHEVVELSAVTGVKIE